MSKSNASTPDARGGKCLRVLLGKADLTEEAAAIVLELSEADIRAYVAAEKPVPRYVILALERIVDLRMDGR